MTKTIEIGDLVKIVKLNKTTILYSLDHDGTMKEMLGKDFIVEDVFNEEGLKLRHHTKDVTYLFAIEDMELCTTPQIKYETVVFDPNDLFI